MEKKILKIIQKSLGLEETPNLEDHLFDDLNLHPEELEKLQLAIKENFDVALEETDMENTTLIFDIVNLIKDKMDDIS